MKYFTKISGYFGLIFILASCFDADEFPSTPQIEFESLRYVDTEGTDSLVLSFRFQDGDGDIGLDNTFNDLTRPYQIFSVILDANDSVVSISGEGYELPFYSSPILVDQQNGEAVYFFFPEQKELFSDEDDRPVYNCDHYEIIDQEDTIYIARNEFHNNFHVEFLEKNGGNYSPIDFNSIFNSDDCTLGDFNGRIPFFDPNGKEGTFTYAMLSQAFKLAFQDDTVKLRFFIYDRALNKSNVEETPDFVLNDLL